MNTPPPPSPLPISPHTELQLELQHLNEKEKGKNSGFSSPPTYIFLFMHISCQGKYDYTPAMGTKGEIDIHITRNL
ncbi:hypothetical protein E2C01_017212 [Portunus trituberculatus]|uniref:Uncharacterized protein n=1 Tax=Portunus trituberculatus TaxID=210409 RepID=A0A5B7DRS6_PORTR|nr:hypothetical protein [Portunus trituberculatus]